ncbi:hypothetical protein KCU71_g23471, partial [Aureobasidium melanogenum]
MAEEELQAKLRELDHELEEGDITKKGYEKRRTLLLSQFYGHGELDALSSPDRSRTASLANISA